MEMAEEDLATGDVCMEDTLEQTLEHLAQTTRCLHQEQAEWDAQVQRLLTGLEEDAAEDRWTQWNERMAAIHAQCLAEIRTTNQRPDFLLRLLDALDEFEP